MKNWIFSGVGVLGLLASMVSPLRADRYVAQAGQVEDPLGQYTDWSSAASNIQTAVDAAQPDETVWISNGVYRSAAAQVVTLDKGLQLRGVSGDPDDVIIDADGSYATPRRGIFLTYPEPAYVLLEGLTVSNAFQHSANGAGILLSHTSVLSGTAVVQRCVITHNMATNTIGSTTRRHGGGLYSAGQTGSAFELRILQCQVSDNFAVGNAGGLYIRNACFLMEDCVIERNVSRGDSSGGMMVSSTNAMIRGTVFEDNQGGAWAGAVELQGGGLFENCLFRGNAASNAGAVLNRIPASPEAVFRNCLVVDNLGGYAGGGFYLWGSTNRIENCTLVGNGTYGINNNLYTYTDPDAVPVLTLVNTIMTDALYNYNGEFYATNCLTAGPTLLPGVNNLAGDPLFVNAQEGDYRLQAGSPAVNSGVNLPWMVGARDLGGAPRLDIGPGIVDRGCYERVYSGTALLLR